MLNNCETWTELSKKSIDILDEIQYMFLRYLKATPRSCPIPSLQKPRKNDPTLVWKKKCHTQITNYDYITVERAVNKKTKEINKTDVLEKIRKYKKLDFQTLSSENFETKDYLKNLHLSDARLRFSLRSKMTRTVQMNFKGELKFKKNFKKP